MALLDDDERTRLTAMSPDRQRAFVTARALLRRVVGAHLGLRPSDVPLSARCDRCGGPHGRVTVVGHDVEVSVSRPGPLVAVAVGSGGRLGVDVEEVDRVARAPLVRVLPVEGASDDHVARSWVRREAVLKAVGAGLRLDPGAVLVGDGTARVVTARGDVDLWLVDVVLPRASRAVAALAGLRPADAPLGRLEARWAAQDGPATR